MSTGERRQNIEKHLEEAVELERELNELLLGSVNDPVATHKHKIELRKVQSEIKRLENELDELNVSNASTSSSERLAVITYLASLQKDFEKYETHQAVALVHRPGKRVHKILPAPLTKQEEELAALLKNHLRSRLSMVVTPTPDETQPSVSLEDFLNLNTRITLLGKPGAGKSTTLRRLAMQLGKCYRDPRSTPWLPSKLRGCIPIYLPLNRWTLDEDGLRTDLWKFVVEEVASVSAGLAKLLPGLAKAGRLVLLLDGLNELPRSGNRPKAEQTADPRVAAIEKLGSRYDYAKVKCVVSCRIKDFSGGLEWYDLHVQDLNTEQVLELAEAYYPEDTERAALLENLKMLFDDATPRLARLRGLAVQPFYLIRLLEYNRMNQGLPNDPTILLEWSVGKTLDREIQHELLTEEQAEELKLALARLAFHMTVAGRVSTVDKNQAAVWLSNRQPSNPVATAQEIEQASTWLRQAEGASLINLNEDGEQIEFYHQLIQAYFAACYCEAQPLERTLLEQTAAPSFREVLPIWNTRTGDEVFNRFTAMLRDHESLVMRQKAASAVGWIDHEESVSRLLEAFSNEPNSFVRERITDELKELHSPEAIAGLLSILQTDQESLVRQRAASALVIVQNEAAINGLIAALQNDPNPDVRWRVVKALAEIGSLVALPALQQAKQDEGENIWGDKIKEAANAAAWSIRIRNTIGKLGRLSYYKSLQIDHYSVGGLRPRAPA